MLGAEKQSWQPAACPHSRRQILAGAFLATMAAAPWGGPPQARALPLAQLGGIERVGGTKLTGLTAEEVKVRLLVAGREPGVKRAFCELGSAVSCLSEVTKMRYSLPVDCDVAIRRISWRET